MGVDTGTHVLEGSMHYNNYNYIFTLQKRKFYKKPSQIYKQRNRMKVHLHTLSVINQIRHLYPPGHLYHKLNIKTLINYQVRYMHWGFLFTSMLLTSFIYIFCIISSQECQLHLIKNLEMCPWKQSLQNYTPGCNIYPSKPAKLHNHDIITEHKY